ncbi:hypothetical protein [Enterovibrio nigricans]|uniref:Uncharacterized protein n=1 Tax=Enterovibrio nigricans DSM 22720 TaxID=1121868 RepID=A0A1T4W0V0_9GAMM|nr:hypothetical protein [Enterovibrio nigricans]SKA70817.1 hypothetical protein SAMN02745132_04633 [Enterovibrio nigricans DSM 22720]
MQINAPMLAIALLFSFPIFAAEEKTTEWPLDFSWKREKVPPPPEYKPYQLPTLHGDSPHYNTPTPALKRAPKADPDAIYQSVINCYPEKSKFKLDIDLVAGVKSSFDQYESNNWPEISEHYVGIVGKMPLYSTTEQARERQWEYQRRTATATAVAEFVDAMANRNHAYRMMGLYLSLEARSQARVAEGVANITEQVAYLETVASSQRDILKFEAKVTEHRLALSAMCDDGKAPEVNNYLKRLAWLPTAKESNG